MADLSYAGLKDMKKSDFVKAFKKPAPWKKATAVLFLAKYKFSNGKVNLVAVPYKKYSEAAKEYKKTVKPETAPKLMLLAYLNRSKGENGNIVFEVTPTQGSMNLDFLQTYGADLFSALKVDIKVLGDESKMDGKLDEEDLLEVVEAYNEGVEEDEKESTDEDVIEKTIMSQTKRLEKAKEIQDKVGEVEKAIGKANTAKLSKSLKMLKKVVKTLKKQALKDDKKIDPTEQAEIDALEALVEEKEQLVEDVDKAKKAATTMQKLLQQLKKTTL